MPTRPHSAMASPKIGRIEGSLRAGAAALLWERMTDGHYTNTMTTMVAEQRRDVAGERWHLELVLVGVGLVAGDRRFGLR